MMKRSHAFLARRAAYAELLDTVSAMRGEKHAFRGGVWAQVGIDL
jgi:ATP:corrinoid adenosyltransferase